MSLKAFARLSAVLGLILTTTVASATPIRITEWMYNGLGAGSIGEYVELTNVGPGNVDMTGWSFDDNSRAPGSQSLSGLGIVVPGQSVILTDLTAAAFRTNWGLPGTVAVVGGNTNNLGRADEINIYDNTNALIDRLTYDDQTLGGPRTNGVSGNPNSFATLGANVHAQWSLSSNGDSFGSYTSQAGEIGNPGTYPVPEPSTLILAGLAVGGFVVVRRRAN